MGYSPDDLPGFARDYAGTVPVGVKEYDEATYVVLDDNIPSFTPQELQAEAYEYYSELDYLGRCGAATAMIGQELMPTEERGSIGQVKPSSWHTVRYDVVDGK